MIILGLGSNLPSSFGDCFTNLEITISLLEKYEIKVLKKSSLYKTPAYPNKSDPPFINMVAQVETKLDPVNLASVLIFIEEMLQRKRNKKNDPRTCDIDIIDFNNEIITFKYLDHEYFVPHKELSSRNFVLYPLKEICPSWIHPKDNINIDVLINKLSQEDKNAILKVEKP
jgi:2-amino-4-hydroxy-6-hydroxymethyldihydropteridine diphosphokinase